MDHRYLDPSQVNELQLPGIVDDLEKMAVRILGPQAEWTSRLLKPAADDDANELDRVLIAGNQLTSLTQPDIELPSYRQMVDQIADLIRINSPARPQVQDLVPPGLPVDEPGFLSRILNRDPGIPFLPQMVCSLALIPWYTAFAHGLTSRANLGLWTGGQCPVCGQPPLMGMLRPDDGARILECWLCRAQWGFPRLQCPSCGTSDQERLRLFTFTGDDAHRVHICDECGRYLKVVDARLMGREPVLALEDAATMSHDSAALREGLIPFGRSPFLQVPLS